MSKPLTYQVVARAREIITDPEHWTEQVLAEFRDGRSTDPHDPLAVRFCAAGALQRAAHKLVRRSQTPIKQVQALAYRAQQDLHEFANLTDAAGLEWLNDTHGHTAILRLFDDYLAAR